MYSFYGGRPGNSFVITKTYNSYEQMEEDFQKTDCTVHYDEHVLINCSNRNNEEHGKIYRRGYEEPVYIGSIAGPAGPPPDLKLINSEDFSKIAQDNENFSTGQIDTIDGATYPAPIWQTYEVTTEDNSNKTVYLNLQMPYPVFSFSAQSVSPYKSDGTTIRDTDPMEAETTLIKGNPFHYNVKFSIPTGLNGSGLQNFEIREEKDENNQLTGYYLLHYQEVNGNSNTAQRNVRIPIRNTGIKQMQQNSNTGQVTITLQNNDNFSFLSMPQNGLIKNLTFNENDGTLAIQQKGVTDNISTKIPVITNIGVSNNKIYLETLENGITKRIESQNSLQDKTKVADLRINSQGALQAFWTGQGWRTIDSLNRISNIQINNDNRTLQVQRNGSDVWQEIGAPYTYSTGLLEDIDWLGVGTITKTNDIIALKFYLPFNVHIAKNTNINIHSGTIQIEYDYLDENSQIQKNTISINAFDNSEITPAYTGLQFYIPLDSEDLEAPFQNNEHYVNIKISTLILELSPIPGFEDDNETKDLSVEQLPYDSSISYSDSDIEMEEESQSSIVDDDVNSNT